MPSETKSERLRRIAYAGRRGLPAYDRMALRTIADEIEQDPIEQARTELKRVSGEVAALSRALGTLERLQTIVGKDDVDGLLWLLDREDTSACRQASKLIRSVRTTISEDT